MRASSEGERRHPLAAAGLGVLALMLAGCQTLDSVRRTIDPGAEQVAIEPATAPPADTKPTDAGQDFKLRGEAQSAAAEPGDGTPAKPAETPAATPEPRGTLELTPPPGVKPEIKVALLLPLSGPHAGLGQGMLNAAQLALFGLADDSFALLPLDTGGTPEGAAAAAVRARDQGARLILGPLFGSSVAAVAPIAQAARIQVVAFSNDRAVAGNGVYVMGFAPEIQTLRVLSHARAAGMQRVVALLPAGPFGDRIAATLQAIDPTLGLEIKTVARYGATDTDSLTPLVKQIADYDARHKALLEQRKELEKLDDEASKRALKRLEKLDTLGDVDFDGVFLPQGGPGLRALAPLLRFYDVDPRKVRLLGTVDWNDPAIATEPALYGGWFTAPPPAARQGFEKAYKAAYGSLPPALASLSYDATSLAAVIAQSPPPPPPPTGKLTVVTAEPVPPVPAPAGPQQAFSARALTSPNGFAGADGIFRLLPSGLVERGYAVMEVRPRRIVVLSPAPATFQQLSN